MLIFLANFRKLSSEMDKAGMFPMETRREQGTKETGVFLEGFLTQGLVSSAETKISVQVQSLIDLEGTTSTALFSGVRGDA